MVLIRQSRNIINGIVWRQGKIRFRVEVDVIEGRGAYRRSRFEGGNDLIPPDLHRGDQGQAHVRGDTIIGQGVSKEEEVRSILGGSFCQSDPIRNGLFLDTVKTPASVYCDNLLEKPVTLSLYQVIRLTRSFHQLPAMRDQENTIMSQGEGGRPKMGP